jgi:hypothetical protein
MVETPGTGLLHASDAPSAVALLTEAVAETDHNPAADPLMGGRSCRCVGDRWLPYEMTLRLRSPYIIRERYTAWA